MPYYLNPEVLNRQEEEEEEESIETLETAADADAQDDLSESRGNDSKEPDDQDLHEETGDNILAGHSPERIETVLNSGMQFMAGLMEMATGKKMGPLENQEKMLTIDRNTGEVTMKFKLPGF